MSRQLLIAGNWKLNLGPQNAQTLATTLRDTLSKRNSVQITLFPTALSIPGVLTATTGSGIAVGLQNLHTAPEGAYTGENSANMARAIGCTTALIGHSERRHLFDETNAATGLKVLAARLAGLAPVLCVGETLEQRQSGDAIQTVINQLKAGLHHLQIDQLSGTVLAYEPVWAIGTGVVAAPEQAQEMHSSIRDWLNDQFPPFVAKETQIIYGGSVKPSNARELLECPDIDGALVGGASLDPISFTQIVDSAVRLSNC